MAKKKVDINKNEVQTTKKLYNQLGSVKASIEISGLPLWFVEYVTETNYQIYDDYRGNLFVVEKITSVEETETEKVTTTEYKVLFNTPATSTVKALETQAKCNQIIADYTKKTKKE